jgi:hypothetical protein
VVKDLLEAAGLEADVLVPLPPHHYTESDGEESSKTLTLTLMDALSKCYDLRYGLEVWVWDVCGSC